MTEWWLEVWNAERDATRVNVLEFPCTICNAKPGERCGNMLDASQYRDVPHARRIELARRSA